MKKILSTIAAISVILGAIAGFYLVDDRYAKASDLKQNYKADKIDTLKNNIRWYQDQMSYIMNRCGKRDPKQLPEYAYGSYRKYEQNKNAAELELNSLLTND